MVVPFLLLLARKCVDARGGPVYDLVASRSAAHECFSRSCGESCGSSSERRRDYAARPRHSRRRPGAKAAHAATPPTPTAQLSGLAMLPTGGHQWASRQHRCRGHAPITDLKSTARSSSSTCLRWSLALWFPDHEFDLAGGAGRLSLPLRASATAEDRSTTFCGEERLGPGAVTSEADAVRVGLWAGSRGPKKTSFDWRGRAERVTCDMPSVPVASSFWRRVRYTMSGRGKE